MNLEAKARDECPTGGKHEYDICTGPLGDSRLGKLICNMCGELKPDPAGAATADKYEAGDNALAEYEKEIR